MLAPVGPHRASARSPSLPRPRRHASPPEPQASAYVAGGAPSGGAAVCARTASLHGHSDVEFVHDERNPAGRVQPDSGFRWPRSAATTEDLDSAEVPGYGLFSKGRAHTRRYTTLGRLLLKRRGASFTGAGSTFRPGSRRLRAGHGSATTEENACQLVHELVDNRTDVHQAGPLLPTRPELLPPVHLDAPFRLRDDVKPRNGAWPKVVQDELGVRIPRAAGRHRALTRPTTRKTRRSERPGHHR